MGDVDATALEAAIRRAVRAELDAQPAAPAAATKAITFSEGFERYGETISFARYRALCSLLKPVLKQFGHREIATLRRADYTTFRERDLKTKTRYGRPPAVSTVNGRYKQTNRVLNWLVEQDEIRFNPWAGIKRKPGGHRRETVIDREELTEACDGASDLARAVLTVGRGTGMRPNEIRLLEWEHVLWTEHRIWIPKANTKTKKARFAPLPDDVRHAIESMPRNLASPYVFANPKRGGKPYTRCRIWQLTRVVLDKLTPAAGDENVHAHDNRHSLVTELIGLGVPTYKSMKIVGHESAAEHWRYDHLSPADMDEARKLLDGKRKDARRAPAARRQYRSRQQSR